jgi:hypothetical protein
MEANVRISEDVPKTAEQAVPSGWSWLRVECLRCIHRRDFSLLNLMETRCGMSLAGYAVKLVCRNCKSRDLAFALGVHPSRASASAGTYKAIAFRDGLAVRPPQG